MSFAPSCEAERNRQTTLVTLLVLAGAIGACRAPKQGSTTQSVSSGGRAEVGATSPCDGAGLREPPAPKGDRATIVFALGQGGVDPCSVTGYVVGHADTTALESAGNGIYYIPDAPAGAQDVIIEAREGSGVTAGAYLPADVSGSNLSIGAANQPGGSAERDTPSARLGIRVNAITARAGETVTLPKSTFLQPVGGMRGKARLEGQTSHPGILVNVPGTRYVAYTADDGSYLLDGVVPGVHELSFSHDQYLPARLADVAVRSASLVDVEDVLLRLNRGVATGIIVDPADVVSTEADGTIVSHDLAVAFTLIPANRPVKMRISERAGCPDALATPFRSAGAITFGVSDELRRDGTTLATIVVCLVDKDNTMSELTQRVRIAPLGTAVPDFVVPAEVDRVYPFLPVAISASAAAAGTSLQVFSSGVSPSEQFSAVIDPTRHGLVASALGGVVRYPLAVPQRCGPRAIHARLIGDLPGYGQIASRTVSKVVDVLCFRSIASQGRPDFASPTTRFPAALWLGDRLLSYVNWGDSFARTYDQWSKSWTTVPIGPRYGHGAFDYVTKWDDRQLLLLTEEDESGFFDPALATWSMFKNKLNVITDTTILFCGDRLYNGSVAAHPTPGIFPPVVTAHVLDRSSLSWHDVARSPVLEHDQPGAACADGKMFFFGGARLSDGAPLGGGAIYDPLRNSWQTLPGGGAPAPRRRPFVKQIGRRVLVFGGYGPGILADGAAYDLDTGQWSALASAPVGFAKPQVVQSESGDDVVVTIGVATYVYDPRKDAWRTLLQDDCAAAQSSGVVQLTSSLIQWPPRCGSYFSDFVAPSWGGRAGVVTPQLADTTSAWTISAAGERFVVYERASNASEVFRTAAFIGIEGSSPLEMTWFSPNDRRRALVKPGESFGIGYRVVNAQIPTSGGRLRVLSVSGPGTVERDSADLPALSAGEAKNVAAAESVRIKAGEGDGAGGTIAVTLAYETNEGYAGQVSTRFVVDWIGLWASAVKPSAALRSPGQTGSVTVKLANLSGSAMSSVRLSPVAGACTSVASGDLLVPDLAAGGTTDVTFPMALTGSCALGDKAEVRFNGTAISDGTSRSFAVAPAVFRVGDYTYSVIASSPGTLPSDGSSITVPITVGATGVVDTFTIEARVTDPVDEGQKLSARLWTPSGNANVYLTLDPIGGGVFRYEAAAGSYSGEDVNGVWSLELSLQDANASNVGVDNIKLTLRAR